MARFCVGLTGGIASGKTTASRAFAALGITTADADIAARQAVAPGSPGLAALVQAFGTGILDVAGELDRRRMRERVFSDPGAKRQLESVVHPIVRRDLAAQCAAAPGPYAVAVIPLLTEGGGREAYAWLDRVLVVDVDADRQIERLVQRDGISAELAGRMLAAQATRRQRLAIADDVLVNAGAPDALARHVGELDRRYRQLAEPPRVFAPY